MLSRLFCLINLSFGGTQQPLDMCMYRTQKVIHCMFDDYNKLYVKEYASTSENIR